MTKITDSNLAPQLQAGLNLLGIALPETAIEKLLAYLYLLDKWNQAYNLTAVRNLPDMVSLHLLDSLAILPHLQGKVFLDVGTGAGLPGIPLAIARPDWTLHLLDSNGKKTRFLTQAKLELGLGNVMIHQCRSEAFPADPLIDTIVSRAYSSLADFIATTRHINPRAIWVAMKGNLSDTERKALPDGVSIIAQIHLQVPGVEGERQLVVVERND